MSNRKKKNKNRKLNAKILELEELKRQILVLEAKLQEQEKENFKQFNIRNLKVFVNTCNFISPFVLSTVLTTGVFFFFGQGLPFYLDKITKYKTYNLDYQTDGNVTITEEYLTYRLIDGDFPASSLVVYTPWEKQDEYYVRFKKEYDIDDRDLKTLDLYNAILDEDYNYVLENLKEYKEEKQVINEIGLKLENDYLFDAELHILDANDILVYNETDSKNIRTTICDLILALGIGSVIAYFRSFNLLDEIGKINSDYSNKITLVKPLKRVLNDTKKKYLSLAREVTPNER